MLSPAAETPLLPNRATDQTPGLQPVRIRLHRSYGEAVPSFGVNGSLPI